MALYVTIRINDETIRAYGAQNITPNLTKTCSYRLCKYNSKGRRVDFDGDNVIFHKPSDGAIVLAKKILEYVIERGG
jgi:hypothetical protein